jgi:cytoskeletal protein CcmA (bactofilin family)
MLKSKSKSKKTESSITTFLGSDANIEGSIDFKGTIRLDGRVKGKITSIDGTVVVGEKAVIEADINVDTAIIKGKVTGTINARNKIEVFPPGSVDGDIHAPTIAIDAGVKFNGNCEMVRKTITSNPAEKTDKSESSAIVSKIKNFPKNL